MWIYFYVAHLLGDFIFQSKQSIEARKEKPIITLMKHVTIHVILMGIASFVMLLIHQLFFSEALWRLGQAIIMIAIFHFVIDYGKIQLSKKMNSGGSLAILFLADQILHLLAIIFIFNFFTGTTSLSEHFQAIYSVFTGEVNFFEKIGVTICIFILATYGAGYFLGILLQNIAPNYHFQDGIYRISDEKTEIKTKYENDGRQETEITTVKTEQYFHDSPAKIGQIIGMLERTLIVVLMMIELPQGLAFLAALKTLTRFKQFENKQFAEYYLIGTLSSSLIGIILGVIASNIW